MDENYSFDKPAEEKAAKNRSDTLLEPVGQAVVVAPIGLGSASEKASGADLTALPADIASGAGNVAKLAGDAGDILGDAVGSIGEVLAGIADIF